MNIKRKRTNKLTNTKKSSSTVSFANELLWAIIGLLLTIFSTFVEAFVTNMPWTWAQQGVNSMPLGVTFQVGAVLLTGCMGGKNAGFLAQVAYIFLGLFWFPIFAQGGGLQYWQQPSFGYILGFMPGAWLCGWVAFQRRTKLELLALSAAAGLLIIHICGLIYLVGLWLFSSSELPSNNLVDLMVNYSVEPIPGQLVVVCTVAVLAFILRHILFY
ncbi:biotin transporter BioY [Crocosphaera sp.]|uniref:biotin transporter BioY n=1 Tax=Crocosphaera sp. TaxID=2729996 RepID=UPI003F263FA4|nr:biotin transporter BioY [Crocosphaera sp.]